MRSPTGAAASMGAAARADAGLATELRIAVTKLRRRLAAERDPGNPLPVSAMAVLIALKSEGGATLGELAAREEVQPPSMTRLINLLAEGGYVERRPCEGDRRMVQVTLTERGVAMVLADRARRDEWLTERLAELSSREIDTLRRAIPLLDRVRGA